GKPLLLWVAERIAAEAPEYPLWFAVDDERLRSCVEGSGFKAIMTNSSHQSGTDRLAEANRSIGAEHVINVQADEPLITGRQIRMLADLLRVGDAPMATLGTPFKTAADFANPNQVKVVIAPHARRALYFSRSPIPFARDRGGQVDDAWVTAHPCYKHLGLYGYRANLLDQFSRLPLGRLEQIEKLEQLRVLENGYEIACDVTEDPTIGVDTVEDAVKFEEYLGGRA
ncbi:MAG TPA: 3-deoxy-manno-octulosonate cytidylyltransferase, partial [Opitutaceae bacterium]|nr:3-deoxy-manno-octulosonate cytidylyltransferase [Opitutaceae bacterium]